MNDGDEETAPSKSKKSVKRRKVRRHRLAQKRVVITEEQRCQ
jgi:hypothetical protein